MCMQGLMKFHPLLLKKKLRKQNVTDGRTHNVKTVYRPTNTVCGGYNKKLAASKAYSIPPQCVDQNPVNLSKLFFSIKLLHAHFQYVCNIPTMHLKDTLKALIGVDFTK